MQDKLYASVLAVIGTPPSTWHHDWLDMLTGLRTKLPALVVNGVTVNAPISTYLMYLLSRPDKNYCAYLQSIMCAENVAAFAEFFEEARKDAAIIAATDDSNFQQELTAFDDLEKTIENPHLYISPLFRYIMAMYMSYDFLVTDCLYRDAKYQLRQNPHFFEAYGEEYKTYMPLLWEEI